MTQDIKALAEELIKRWEKIAPTLPVADMYDLQAYEEAAKLTSPTIARALLDALERQPITAEDVRAAYAVMAADIVQTNKSRPVNVVEMYEGLADALNRAKGD